MDIITYALDHRVEVTPAPAVRPPLVVAGR